MNYTASSVKKEIETNAILTVKGDLQCPQSTAWAGTGNTPCSQNPSSCPHTLSQACKQRIRIDEQGTNLIILTFNFTISPTDYRGYIDEHDRQLNRLICYGETSNKFSIDPSRFDKF